MPKSFFVSTPDYQISSMLCESFGWVELVDIAAQPDFVVVPGGADINPSLYGEKVRLKTNSASHHRDFRDMSCILSARLRGIPVIGICRGMQMLHVSIGGTLHQHIIDHADFDHSIEVLSGHEVFDLHQPVITNTYHHQQVVEDEVDNYDLVMGIRAKRNHIEVIYSKPFNFLGVQFHPEYDKLGGSSLTLFENLVKNIYGE